MEEALAPLPQMRKEFLRSGKIRQPAGCRRYERISLVYPLSDRKHKYYKALFKFMLPVIPPQCHCRRHCCRLFISLSRIFSSPHR